MNFTGKSIVGQMTISLHVFYLKKNPSTEHVPPGVEKIKLPDTVDRDEVDELDDPPSVVCYFIVYGNADEIFHLEPESHILTVYFRC